MVGDHSKRGNQREGRETVLDRIWKQYKQGSRMLKKNESG